MNWNSHCQTKKQHKFICFPTEFAMEIFQFVFNYNELHINSEHLHPSNKRLFFFLSSYVKNLATSYRYKISIQGSIYEYQRGVMTSKDQIKLFWRVHLITWRTRVSKSGSQYNETDQVRPKNFITYHCSICKDVYFD